MADKRIQAIAAAPVGTPIFTDAAMTGVVGGDVQGNLPAPQTAFELSNERLQREQKATVGDYVGSMFRQDSLIDGTVANIVGRQMMPDENYNVHDSKTWAELIQGIAPEFQNAFYDAQSPAHAMMIRERILQKQEDLTRLGDMGVAGNIGRFALGVVQPDQLLAGMAGGWVSKGFKAAELAANMGKGMSAIGKAETAAGVAVSQAGRASGAGAVLAGVVSGAAGNAAFEKIRQNVSFEDSTSQVVEAGLMGAAITAPFAFAGARSQGRIAAAASREHEALRVLRAVDEGTPMTAADAKVLKTVVDTHQTVMDLRSGLIDPIEARKQLDAHHFGPELEDAAWLKQYGDDLKVRGEAILDQLYPNRITERTSKVFQETGPKTELLEYDPNARNGAFNALKVDPNGTVAPALDMASMTATLTADAARLFPKDAAKQALFVQDGLSRAAGVEPVRFARQAKDASKKATMALAREANKGKPKATPQALFEAADAADMPSAKVDVGGLKKMIDDANGEVKEPVAAAVPAQAAPETVAPTPTAPRPGSLKVGELANFSTRSAPDEPLSGIIQSVSDQNFYKVVDEDGKVHTVHHDRIDEHAEIPSGFLPGSVGAAQVGAISDPATQLTAMSKARLDIYATLNRSESDAVKKLTFDLVKDAIQNDARSAQSMTASEHKSLIKRTVAGLFHRDSREAANEAAAAQGIKMWQRFSGEWDSNFHSLVSRYTRGDLSIQIANADILPMIRKASAAQRKVYEHLLEQAKAMGVKGAENVDANSQYVNRIWNQKGINDAYRLHGADAVHALLARSINVPGYIGDKAKAAQFLGTVRKLEFSPVMQNIHLYAQDMASLRKVLATEGKLADHEIDNVVDLMFTAKEADGKDTGRTSSLKYRFDIDETMSQNVNGKVLRISDLFENDSRVLVDLYTNSMGGQIALAKKGIKSQADFMERMRSIGDDLDKNPQWDQAKAKRDMRLLEDVYANISGKPMSTQDFSPSARIAGTMRGYTRALMLGQLGLTAAFEMAQAVAYMGVKAAIQQMPTFRGFLSAVRTGHIPDVKLARDIEHMVGFGTEMDMSFARAHEIDEGGMGMALTKAESGANKASHAVDIMSGNASITSITRQWAGMMAVQDMHDFATGLKKLTDAHRERFVGHGLDYFETDVVLKDLKQYSTATNHKLESVDWEKWLKEEPETYEKFQTALSRKVRDAVQDHDLGETMPFMHTTLGKVAAELKTFILVAHAKNFLKNLHYRDQTTMNVFAISFMGNALAYMTQTSMNYAHDPEKLREMLTLDKIALAVAARTAALGVIPLVAETAYGIGTGGDKLFSSGTANTDNRSMVPPSLINLQRIYQAPFTLAGMANPNAVTTQKEIRNLPLPNLYGMRNLGNWWASSFPKSDPTQGQ